MADSFDGCAVCRSLVRVGGDSEANSLKAVLNLSLHRWCTRLE